MSNGQRVLKKDSTIGLKNGRNELVGEVVGGAVSISSALVQVKLVFDPKAIKKRAEEGEDFSLTIVMSKSKWEDLKSELERLERDENGKKLTLAAIFPTNIELELPLDN